MNRQWRSQKKISGGAQPNPLLVRKVASAPKARERKIFLGFRAACTAFFKNFSFLGVLVKDFPPDPRF